MKNYVWLQIEEPVALIKYSDHNINIFQIHEQYQTNKGTLPSNGLSPS